MLLCDAIFRPREGSLQQPLGVAVVGLFAARQRAGQVWGEPTIGWIDHSWHVRHLIPRTDALARRGDTGEVTASLAEIRRMCAGDPRFVIHPGDPGVGPPVGALRGTSSLALEVARLPWASPVRRGDDGRVIPLYELPIAEATRLEIGRWTRAVAAHVELARGDGELAARARVELLRDDGELQQRARWIGRELAAATGVPVQVLRFVGDELASTAGPRAANAT